LESSIATGGSPGDTISAIATPKGEGGLSVIRLSGPDAVTIARALFVKANGKPLSEKMVPQKAYFGELRSAEGTCIDEAILTWFKAPKSYTAEDVVEICVHGGQYVSLKVLQRTLEAGARMAEPGEFTRRAFVNGRIDLSQAEAVIDVIHSASDQALKTATAQLKGNLSKKLSDLYDDVLAVLSQLSAAIDFPEDDLKFVQQAELLRKIGAIQSSITQLLGTYRQGKIFREGARVLLIGKPNVGKSSLMNALLDEERAIVTPHSGTTRDLLEESIRLRDIHINLIDSAGLRDNPEAIEEIGIERARNALKEADLAVVLFDQSRPLDESDRLLLCVVENKVRIAVLNKTDLPAKLDHSDLKQRLAGTPLLSISAKSLEGLEALKDAIYEKVAKGEHASESIVISRERHRSALAQTLEALERARESVENQLSEEFVAVDVQMAMDHLGGIVGKNFDEDLLDQIFNEFCIGK